jgi:hypothetical protein
MTKYTSKRNFVERLTDESCYVKNLNKAASHMYYNFIWMDTNQYDHIPLLDYDIISYSCPSVAIKRHLETLNEGTDNAKDADVLSLRNFIGPHTSSVLLENITNYCLPEGTVAELLKYIHIQKANLSEDASNLLQTIEDGFRQKVVNPVTMVLQDTRSWQEKAHIILKELKYFITNVHELNLCELLLTRNTPTRDLTGLQSDSDSLRAYKDVFAQLKAKRYHKEYNNYHDALNYALFVKAFNNQIRRGTGQRIPFLFSNTDIILAINASSWLNIKDIDNRPHLLNNSHYLVMDQFLLNYCDKNYKMAANESLNLERRLWAIHNRLMQLIGACNQLEQQGRSKASLTEKDLPKYEYEMLLYHKERLLQDWKDIFDLPLRSIACDRIEYLNKILIEQAKDSSPKDALLNLKDTIRQHEKLYNSIWMPVQHYAEIELPRLSYRTFDIELSAMQNKGVLLTEIEPQKSIDLDEINWKNHDVLVCGHFRNHNIFGALFTLGSYIDSESPGRHITCTWQYGADRLTIVNYGFKLMQLQKGCDYSELDCKVFTPSEEINIPATNAEGFSKHTETFEYEFVKIRLNEILFRADIYPVEHRELHAIFSIPEHKWDINVLNLLVGAICETSCFPLPFNTYREAVEKSAQILRLYADN